MILKETLDFEWEKVLVDSVKDGKIRELYLGKIPVLKACNDWKLVQPIGSVDYQMSLAHYKGIIAKYKSKIYFIPENVVNALAEFVKWKVFPQS